MATDVFAVADWLSPAAIAIVVEGIVVAGAELPEHAPAISTQHGMAYFTAVPGYRALRRLWLGAPALSWLGS